MRSPATHWAHRHRHASLRPARVCRVSPPPLFFNAAPSPPPFAGENKRKKEEGPKKALTTYLLFSMEMRASEEFKKEADGKTCGYLPPSLMTSLVTSLMCAVWICSPWARVLTAITVERAQVRRDYQTLGGEMEIGRRCDEGGAPLRPSAVRPPTSREPAAWSLTALTARAQKFEKAALADKERYKTECAAVRFGALCLPC